MPEIKIEKSIHLKLQQDVRLPISKMNLKKTGYNAHLKYHYYELDDFQPQATELFAKAGLCPIFNIINDERTGIEKAVITLTDGINQMTFEIPTAEVPNMNGVFNLGSKDTYCLRFLMVRHVLMLSEQDPAELSNTDENKNEKIEEKKATPNQVEMIKKLYDVENIARMLKYYQAESLEELTIKQASEAIARKKETTNA